MKNTVMRLYGVFSLCFVSAMLLIFPAYVSAATYTIAPRGSDSNTGASGSPFKTFAHAVGRLLPGDTLVVEDGVYRETIVIARSGEMNRPIIIRSASGARPVIDGENVRPTGRITNARYIALAGIALANSSTYALQTENSEYVSVTDCEVSGSADGGLIFHNSARITVDGCDVHDTNRRGLSASHEAVSFANVDTFEIKNSTVRDGGEEGIDAKYGTKNGSIHDNRVIGNNGPNIYVDAASGIRIYNNFVSTTRGDKANVAIAVEENSNRFITRDIQLFNNILHNGRGGISFWVEGGAESYAKIEDVAIYHNLIYGSGDRGAINPGNNGPYLSNILVKNTIFWGNASTIQSPGSFTIDYNLFDRQPLGGHAITVPSVGFVNPNAADFHLTPSSPAIGAGTPLPVAFDFDNRTRSANRPDLGPFAFGQTGPVPPTGTPAPPSRSADLDADGRVTIFDYNILLQSFGRSGSGGWVPADIDKNGKVDIFDYNILVGNFGK